MACCTANRSLVALRNLGVWLSRFMNYLGSERVMALLHGHVLVAIHKKLQYQVVPDLGCVVSASTTRSSVGAAVLRRTRFSWPTKKQGCTALYILLY
jgi:NADPH-dependent 7-cyano-7-deazaguanine reductase QueF